MSLFVRARSLAVVLVLAWSACASPPPREHKPFPVESLRGRLFTPPQVLAEAVREDFGGAPNAIVLAIDEQSSLRAVTSAVARVREADLAVGYWIDVGLQAELPLEQRILRVRAILQDRPAADALFLAGLEGPRASCGCGSFECCASSAHAPTDAARIVAAVRNFSAGALVVPVWLDGCAPLAHECAARGCTDPACASRAKEAWNALVAESPRVALELEPAATLGERGETASLWFAARLRSWRSSSPAATIAVLSPARFGKEQLAQAITALRAAKRTGLLLDDR